MSHNHVEAGETSNLVCTQLHSENIRSLLEIIKVVCSKLHVTSRCLQNFNSKAYVVALVIAYNLPLYSTAADLMVEIMCICTRASYQGVYEAAQNYLEQ